MSFVRRDADRVSEVVVILNLTPVSRQLTGSACRAPANGVRC